MTTVPRAPQVPDDSDVRVARPASALRLAVPVGRTINHVVGHLLGGLRSIQTCGSTPTDTSDTARIVSCRHPNSDYVDVVMRLAGTAKSTPWTVTVTAGTGASRTVTQSTTLTDYATIRVRAPWGAADSGDTEITVAYSGVAIRTMAVWDVPRESLDSGDDRITLVDATYSRIGLSVERAIAVSSTAGPQGLIAAISDAWDHCQPQIIGWWTSTSKKLSVSATSYGGSGSASDFFGGATLRARARRKTSATTGTSRWYLYSWCDAAVTGYDLRITSITAGGSVSVSLTNTSGAWTSKMTPLSLDATADDTVVIEGRVTGGSGNIYLQHVSGIAD